MSANTIISSPGYILSQEEHIARTAKRLLPAILRTSRSVHERHFGEKQKRREIARQYAGMEYAGSGHISYES